MSGGYLNRTRRELKALLLERQKQINSDKATIKALRKREFKKSQSNQSPRISKNSLNALKVNYVYSYYRLNGDIYCAILQVKNQVYKLRCTNNYIEHYLNLQEKELENWNENVKYNLSSSEILFYQILKEYIAGVDIRSICQKYYLNKDLLQVEINKFINSLIASNQLRFIINTQLGSRVENFREIDMNLERILNRSAVQVDKLKSCLSIDTSNELTPEETVYCFIYVNTSDNDLALTQSGLLECLIDPKLAYRNLLGIYLRDKANVKAYISKLREERYSTVNITKESIQQELVEQVDQLKELLALKAEDRANRANLLKSLEMLGKTIGAFVEKVEVQEVKPAESIDKLLELARKEIKMIPTSTYEIADAS